MQNFIKAKCYGTCVIMLTQKTNKQNKLDDANENSTVITTSLPWTVISNNVNIIHCGPVKNVALCFCPYLRQLLTNIQNYFTDTLRTICINLIVIYFTTP